jgi:peptidoglycan/xylan/chitin deacetylase (PgdA/CDA1 family)
MNEHPSYFSGLQGMENLFGQGIPILNYHMVAPLPWSRKTKGMYIPPGAFRRQLQELKEAGYETVTLDNCIQAPYQSGPKKFIVTFDDGFLSVHQNAMAILSDLGFSAIQFLVADLIGKSNEWDRALGVQTKPLMSASQIQEWIQAGHSIGSHTQSHPYLTRIPVEQAQREIADSKKSLEDRFQVPIDHFCYPYGDMNTEVKQMVVNAGYLSACTVRFGVCDPKTDSHALPRIKGRHPTRRLGTALKWFSRKANP